MRMARLYSLTKSKEVLHNIYSKFVKKSNSLAPSQAAAIEANLRKLEEAVLNDNRSEADRLARSLQETTPYLSKKTTFQYLWEVVIAVIIAFAIAVVVRQMWFELYEIP